MELKNVEFYSCPGLSDCPVMMIIEGQHIPFSELPDDMVDIIYCRLFDYAKMLHSVKNDRECKRDIVCRFIIRYWSKLDNVPDIDLKGNFNFENVDFNTLRDDLISVANSRIDFLSLEIEQRLRRLKQLRKTIAILTLKEEL
jgi:hypothetical protein